MSAPKIITRYDPKPIPDRRFDWTAVDDNYDLGSPIGHGRTKDEALIDLAHLSLDLAKAAGERFDANIERFFQRFGRN